LCSKFDDSWQLNFLEDIPKEKNNEELWMNLDGLDATIMIQIFPRLQSPNNQTKESLLCLPAQFKLLQICERRINSDSLTTMDAVVGCPILMFDPQRVSLFLFLSFLVDLFSLSKNGAQTNKELACLAYFHAINWFREVLNAFSTQTDPAVTSWTFYFFCFVSSLPFFPWLTSVCH
jgi:hypothetical protein